MVSDDDSLSACNVAVVHVDGTGSLLVPAAEWDDCTLEWRFNSSDYSAPTFAVMQDGILRNTTMEAKIISLILSNV